MAKTHAQIKAERKRKIEERRKYLIENPEVYQRDFDEAFKKYLTRKYPEDLDFEGFVDRFDSHFREEFPWSQEGRELAIKYSLNRAWDPEGDDIPCPAILSPVRAIRLQDDKIWPDQIKKDSVVDLPLEKTFGRFVIVEIDLSKPKRQIETDIMSLVDFERRKLKVTGSHQELVPPPEPRDRASSFTFKKMEVWKMVDEKRRTFNKPESEILWQIAKELCELEGWDKTNEKFEDDPDSEERMIVKRKAIKTAYERDKELYYGEVIFRGISE
jgi:hypothetical protein